MYYYPGKTVQGEGGSPALQSIAGVLLLDKPEGPTSFSMVRQVRRLLGIKKVGHAGTLDPFATGLLIVCVGRPATRKISLFMESDKEYEATLQLGVETSTQDVEGEVVANRHVPALEREAVERRLAAFVGEQMQTPPAFSALKHEGKPLYFYARKGIEVKKEPRRVVILRIGLLRLEGTQMDIRVCCSKGTYIRTLAADIGAALGCGAHLTALRRTRIGPFRVQEALDGGALAGLNPAQLKARLWLTEDILQQLQEGRDSSPSPAPSTAD
jgi:tRNA pseudouridine55 synthase